MKLLNGKLYIEFSECVECGIEANYMSKAKSIGTKTITFLDDPDDRRKVLIEFESLAPRYKELIQRRWPNPYDQLAKEPIRKMVEKDLLAEAWYMEYKFGDNKYLPIDTIKKYVTAASWLNMLKKADANKKEIKRSLSLSIADFYLKVFEIIKDDQIELPTTYKWFREKMKDYQERGYEALIHKQYGNSNAKKLCEISEALLLEMIAIPHHDDTIVCFNYNKWAEENNYKQITPGTVGNYRRANAFQLQGAKAGNKVWYNTFGKQIMRKRPSAPLLLIGSDDNDLDLYFQKDGANKKGYAIVNYFHRFKLIVVMDAFNDYILGFAYANEVTVETVKLAFLDAMYHIRELTGGWYLPHQLQTDRWGKGALDSFYQAIATYTPATAKVARAKYIEQAFGTKWHQTLKMYPNYAGHNITAKTRLNEDNLELLKRDFPHITKAPDYIEDFITRMRNLIDEKTGHSRQAQWLTAFTESEKSQARKISDPQMLLHFGTPHTYINEITNKGVTATINGTERNYEIPADLYLQTIGKRVQVIYEPYDYSRVLVTDGDKLRFIAREYQYMPSAIADFQSGDRARLNNRLEEKKAHVAVIANSKESRQQVLQRNQINAESLLQANVLIKEVNHKAVSDYRQTKQITYNPLDDM